MFTAIVFGAKPVAATTMVCGPCERNPKVQPDAHAPAPASDASPHDALNVVPDSLNVGAITAAPLPSMTFTTNVPGIDAQPRPSHGLEVVSAALSVRVSPPPSTPT